MAKNFDDNQEEMPVFRDDDDPESQKVYSSRGRGAGLNDDDEEGGLYEVIPDFMKRTNNLRESLDSKPIVLEEKKSIIEKNNKPIVEKTTVFTSKPTIADANKAILHLANNIKNVKADKIVKNNRPPEKVEEKKEESKSSKVNTKSSVNNFFKNPFGFKSGGSVRGHGIEQKGRTQGKYC